MVKDNWLTECVYSDSIQIESNKVYRFLPRIHISSLSFADRKLLSI